MYCFIDINCVYNFVYVNIDQLWRIKYTEYFFIRVLCLNSDIGKEYSTYRKIIHEHQEGNITKPNRTKSRTRKRSPHFRLHTSKKILGYPQI